MSEWGWKQILLGAFLAAWVGVIVVADYLAWQHDRKRLRNARNASSEHSGERPNG